MDGPEGMEPPVQEETPPPGQGETPPHGSTPPVTQLPPQGTKGEWMPPPSGPPPNCPPGLEYLASVDRILVKQMVEPLEILTRFECANQYKLTDALGQQVFYATESSECCERMCCGKMRGFTMKIVDNKGQEVMRVIRKFKWCGDNCFACFGMCQMKISVEAPVGTQIGKAKQACGCRTNFVISEPGKKPYCKVKGPGCFVRKFCCCMDQRFTVYQGKHVVGEITKHFSGVLKELFTDADNFTVSFPLDMPVTQKASLIGLLFLIDFIAFET